MSGMFTCQDQAYWYDFWTGKRFDGGLTIKTAAPLDKIPLYIKAGSIIPMGPFIQYSTEKNNPIEIRIYSGADGRFLLYEDENDNYDYEKGNYSLITFEWNNDKKTLTISDRKGKFPGMHIERSFNIVLVDKDNGTGVEISSTFDKNVKYSGKRIVVNF